MSFFHAKCVPRSTNSNRNGDFREGRNGDRDAKQQCVALANGASEQAIAILHTLRED